MTDFSQNRAFCEETNSTFLSFFRASLSGDIVALTSRNSVDWLSLFKLADEQHVFPMILDAVWRSTDLPLELIPQLQNKSIRTVIFQAQRTSAFLELYRYLRSRGLAPLVLKGLVCRALYPEPDQRPSGDEDLLIDPADFPAMHDALLEYGLLCDQEDPDVSMHEITYSAPLLRIELHLSLFSSESDAYGDLNQLFEGALERAMDVVLENEVVRTLASTDHLLYLICHAYKHFLHSGVGIRQIADMALFVNEYGEAIDWEHLYEACRAAHIEVLAASFFRIAHEYLTLRAIPAPFDQIKKDVLPLLGDILSGGVYGKADAERVHSGNITLAAVAAQRENDNSGVGVGKASRSGGIRASLFPGKRYLQEHYPYAKAHPVLLPAAWAQRLFNYLKRNHDGDDAADPIETLRVGQQRVELLKEYDVLR